MRVIVIGIDLFVVEGLVVVVVVRGSIAAVNTHYTHTSKRKRQVRRQQQQLLLLDIHRPMEVNTHTYRVNAKNQPFKENSSLLKLLNIT